MPTPISRRISRPKLGAARGTCRPAYQFAYPGRPYQREDRLRIRRTEPQDYRLFRIGFRWLDTCIGTRDAAFKLMGLVWLRGSADEIGAQADAVLDFQRDDGGWAREPAMAGRAYATGQALYALRLAGVSPSQATSLSSLRSQRGVACAGRLQRPPVVAAPGRF